MEQNRFITLTTKQKIKKMLIIVMCDIALSLLFAAILVMMIYIYINYTVFMSSIFIGTVLCYGIFTYLKNLWNKL